MNKEKFVDKLIKKYNTYDPFEICKKRNINLVYENLGNAVLHSEYNRIFLNSTFYLPSKFENQANRFAAYLILQGYDDNFEDMAIMDVHKITRIPFEYLMLILYLF
ncbi:hypothetical protein [Proteocatella sphenisci]|uniref:hypothetical protein n=1 Tax=Proteocatella sphenisci TaxID=181070 RepID=UPI000490F1C7|nr:hypothetical protein [Proteocatella sphenisci]